MPDKPEISIVIPVYNSDDLEACLTSVQNQTIKNWEVIIVDDGSTNGCIDIARHFVEHDDRFSLIEQKNLGCSAARNAGINAAHGKYLAFIDHDDVYHPQALEILRYMIEATNADVSCFNLQPVEKDFILHNSPHYNPAEIPVYIIDNPFEAFFKYKKCRQVEVWRRMYKMEKIVGVEFPIGVQPGEDDMFNIKVMDKISRQVITEEPLIYYRSSDTSVIKKGITEKFVKSYIKSADIYAEYFKDRSPEIRKMVEKFVSRKLYISCIAYVFRNSRDVERNKLISITRSELVRLHDQKKFRLRHLSLRRQIICRLFFAGHIKLVSFLLKMHKKK